jgi:chromosome segregation ATPase
VTAALEERVEQLEQQVDHLANEQVKPLKEQVARLDTWAGPGQNATLSANLAEFRKQVSGELAELRKDFAKFGKVQSKHAQILKTLTGDVTTLKTDVAALKTDVAALKTDVAALKTDVATLKTDVATLKTDVATLKTDVATLKTDVAGLKSDMVEVKGALSEILDRLPQRKEARD